ncbi:MAG: RNA polymerase sigma factor [Phycisphaerales bacterium]
MSSQPPPSPSDPRAREHDLLRAAVRGDEKALAQLLKDITPQLRARVASKISPVWQGSLDADDVLQVTFVEAFLQIEGFTDRGEGSFLAWLSHIADNNLRDAIKALERAKRPDPRKQVHAGGDDDAYVALVELLGYTSTTPSRAAARGEVHTALDAVLSQLPPAYEQVIRMLDLEGKAPAQAAEALGRTVGATHMLRARAHDRLRELLGSESRYFSRMS